MKNVRNELFIRNVKNNLESVYLFNNNIQFIYSKHTTNELVFYNNLHNQFTNTHSILCLDINTMTYIMQGIIFSLREHIMNDRIYFYKKYFIAAYIKRQF